MRRRASGFRRPVGGKGWAAFLAFLLTIGMLGHGSDSLAQVLASESGNPIQKPAPGPDEFNKPVVMSQHSDGSLASAAPAVVKRAGVSAPGNAVGGSSPVPAATSVPLWQRLADLSQRDRENALIQVEPYGLASTVSLDLTKKAETLWKSGAFDAALNALRS